MKQFVVLLLTLASTYALPSRIAPTVDFEPFIIGGTEAKPNEFPWQLSLQYNYGGSYSHNCGASLLSTKYALTAAHCVDNIPVKAFRIVAGLHKQTDLTKATVVNLTSYKVHEKYNDGTGSVSNDIAILKFAQEIKLTPQIQPIALPKDNKNKFANESCIISGWGRTNSSRLTPDALQKGTVTVLSNAECSKRVGDIGTITDGHVCIFDSKMITSACNGDSGGPLICKESSKNTLVGVTSWVISYMGRCLPSYPSGYTRTSEYLDWIKINTP